MKDSKRAGVNAMTIEALNDELYKARYLTKGSAIRHYPVMFGQQNAEDTEEILKLLRNKGFDLQAEAYLRKGCLFSMIDDQIVITISDDAEGGALQLASGFRSGPSAGRGRGRGRGRGPGPGPGGGNEAEGLPPWHERRSLFRIGLRSEDGDLGAVWENLLIPPPPGPSETLREASVLLRLQARRENDPVRREEIIRQASFGIGDYTAPLGIDSAGGFEATRGLITSILDITMEIGLIYKDRFNRARPNIIEPRLRPFIPVPSHASYPSNHSFQSLAVANVLQRMMPEHPGVTALYTRARRVAENREWAGLHYASDTDAGEELAERITPYLVEAMDETMRRAMREW
ncbi:hypothetical protein [Rhizobium sp. 768_B6_N1_8]|jgi:hypothetical protein|uniref:hypothetical protein n=1 Tax=unclassified Rhizobium TaxID=2613769 RepID=UPI003F20412F